MKNLSLYFAFVLLFLLIGNNKSAAQKLKKEDFFFVDSMAQEAGAMKSYSMQYIVDSLTKNCKTELQMTRAFYFWQTHFVAFDIRRHRNLRLSDNASTALMERKAASKGFAEMFKAMCDIVGIDCKIVKGVWRYRKSDLDHFDADAAHYWNIVSIDNTQFLIDVSLGVGHFDEKGKRFTKEFTDAWWLCNRKLFALSHFPEEASSQLLESPITKSEFTKAPLVFAGAIIAGLIPSKTIKDVLRFKESDTVKIKFHYAGSLMVTSARLSYDKKTKIDIPFDFDEFGFYVKLPSGEEGKHLASLYFNNSLAFMFKTETRKGAKHRN
jgi:transglutaminase/protease-like cytokinesis protein 3